MLREPPVTEPVPEPVSATAPTECAFNSRSCSEFMAARGGFDSHHEFPKFLGGDDGQTTKLWLCPNHHRRQHALIRYLVECAERAVPTSHLVLRAFTETERDAAAVAVSGWQGAGAPRVAYWSTDAAR